MSSAEDQAFELALDLDDPPPGARRIKGALFDDEQIDELADARESLRLIDVGELNPEAAAAVRQSRQQLRAAWRREFESKRETYTLELEPCPSP